MSLVLCYVQGGLCSKIFKGEAFVHVDGFMHAGWEMM